MSEVLNILLTNDDGYRAAGIHVLAEIMCQFGSVTAVAPKFHQSGMSMAVSMMEVSQLTGRVRSNAA